MAGTALGNGFAQAASSSSQHPHLLSGSIDMDPFSAMIFHDDDQEVHAPVLVAAEESALFLVEALYPYAGSEGNHLNFDKGDIIEVWGREESGWWDGFLKQTKVEANREKRGWFPSSESRPTPPSLHGHSQLCMVTDGAIHFATDRLCQAVVGRSQRSCQTSARYSDAAGRTVVAAFRLRSGHSQRTPFRRTRARHAARYYVFSPVFGCLARSASGRTVTERL